MAFRKSSLLIRKSFLVNALSNYGLYLSLLQLSLASIFFSIFLLCLCIVRKPVVFDFITCFGFCKKIILAYQRRAEPFYCSFENVLKLTKDAKQLADITYCLPENVIKHGFFEISFPKSILLVPIFLSIKSGNGFIFKRCICCSNLMTKNFPKLNI